MSQWVDPLLLVGDGAHARAAPRLGLAVSLSTTRNAIWFAVLALAYALTSWIGLGSALTPTHLSSAWPSAAIAVVATLTWGRRAWLGVWFAFMLVFWIAASPDSISLASVGLAGSIAVGGTLQAAVVARLIHRRLPGGPFANAPSVARFAGVAAVGCCLGATWTALTYLLGGVATLDTCLDFWPQWWLGDLTGVLVFAPLLLQWREVLRVSRRRGWIAEAIGTCVAIVLLSTLVAFAWDSASAQHQFLLGLVVLPSVVWIALRFRPPGVALAAAFVSAMAYGGISHRADSLTRDGTSQELLLLQIFAALTSVTGLVLSAAITAQKRAEKAVRAEKGRYLDLFENSPDMLASVDVDTAIITECNQTLAHLLGLTKDNIVGRCVFDLYTPECRDVARRAFDAFLLTGQLRFTELTLQRHNGHKLEVSLTASAVRDASGRIVGGQNAWRDITARKLAERALNESQQIWRTFIAQAPASIAMFDTKMRYLAVSRRFLSDSGFPADHDLYGQSFYDVFPNTPAHWTAAHRRALAGEVVSADEDRYETHDGRVQWLHWEVRPWYDVGGLAGVVLFTEDISHRKHATDELLTLNAELERRVRERTTELERLAREMEERSLTDELTGLPNRRALDHKLGVEARLALRHQIPLSLLMLDIDHFKQYNDSFGHPAGDEVIRTVAQVLQQTIRTTDFAARWGGEEFALVLRHTAEEGAVIVAERIRASLQAVTWPNRAVTVSIGAASMPGGVEDATAMVVAADGALYEAKLRGRNCVVPASAAHENHGEDEQGA